MYFPARSAYVSVFLASLVVYNKVAGVGDWKSAGIYRKPRFDNLGSLSATNSSRATSEATSTNGITDFVNLQGDATSKPCCVAFSPQRIECFIRGPTSNVMHKTIFKWDSPVDTKWENLHGTAMHDIECVADGAGMVYVFIVGEDCHMFGKAYVDGEWESAWTMHRTTTLGVPSCTSKSTSNIDCMVRATNNYAYVSHRNATTPWKSGFTHLSSTVFNYQTECEALDEDVVYCFAVGLTNHYLYYTTLNGSTWSGWVSLNGWTKGRPVATSFSKERLDVFGLNAQNNAVHTAFFDGEWHSMKSLGGSFENPPECVSSNIKSIHCFGVGNHSYLYRNSWNGETWSGWMVFPYIFLDSPSCVAYDVDKVSCFGRNTDREIVEVDFDFS